MELADGPWPRMVVFAVPLRDPLPLPHGSTFTRVLDERVEALAGMEMRVTKDAPALAANSSGQRLASLRIWQLEKQESHDEERLFQGAMQVLDHVGGAQQPTPIKPWSDAPSYRTVVEAVVTLTGPDDMVASPGRPDALTVCLATLFNVIRAYRLLGQVRISELTYERIMPMVPYRFRRIDPPEYFEEPSVLVLDHANVSVPDPDILDQQKIRMQGHVLERLIKQDPFLLYSERRLEARIALSRDGQYAESAIQSAIAAEVLLTGVLGMLLWEESLPDEDLEAAAEVFITDLAKRVRAHYHPRLGGQWVLRGDGPLGRWYADTAGLRNRVVHRGYRPGKDEAESSLQTLYALEKFIADLLGGRSHRYPRTALAMLGADGLTRRGKWSDARFGDQAIGPVTDFMGEYARWLAQVDEAVTRRRAA